MTPLQQRTLQIAKRRLGLTETDGPNRGPVVRWSFDELVRRYHGVREGLPWCAAFATTCVREAARELQVPTAYLSPHVNWASSSAIYRWARENGHVLRKPEDGCIALVKGGRTGHFHTLLVHTVRPDGVLVTVEGNWRNGVRWNRRRDTDALTFLRIE